MLHDVRKLGLTNGYCGPYAICATTGRRWPDVRAVVNQLRGRKPTAAVFGMEPTTLRSAVHAVGAVVAEVIEDGASGSRKIRLLDFIRHARPDHTWIIGLSDHFVALHDQMLADNILGIPLSVERWCSFKRFKARAWVRWAGRIVE